MNKQLIVLVYVFVALTGLSISIHHHWPNGSVANRITIKKNLHAAAEQDSREVLNTKF